MKIWLRAETRKHERRTPLIPAHARALIAQGVHITVESSDRRIYADDDYAAAGCDIVAPASWQNAALDYYFLGIKELPEADFALCHKHIYYADAFERYHMQELLSRFKRGKGIVYDYEYMVDVQARSVVSMSYWAGYCGAAIALLMHKGKKSIPLFFSNTNDLDIHLIRITKRWKSWPQALLIGPGGNAGKGVSYILDRYHIQTKRWYKCDTRHLQHAAPLLDYDLIFNCAALKQKTQPFLTNESFAGNKNRVLIQDISCFLDSVFGNPLPIYDRVTTFDNPVQAITSNVDLIAIDNLPTFLPKESSDTFSTMLFPHLSQLLFHPEMNNTPWKKAEERYHRAQEDKACV